MQRPTAISPRLRFVGLSVVVLLACSSELRPTASAGSADAGATLESGGIYLLTSPRRVACSFAAGALPEETREDSDPHGNEIPIDHFVVIMQENRSFDEYFQMLPQRGVPDADVAPADFSNPDAAGQPQFIYHEDEYCVHDIAHDSASERLQFAHGKQTGFIASAAGDAQVMGYYDESDLPYYYALARTFAIGDRYFSAMLGPTYPNRTFALSGTSFGQLENNLLPAGSTQRSIFQQLQDAGLSWVIYSDTTTFEEKLYAELRGLPGDHFRTTSRFRSDAAADALPNFAWVESKLARMRGDDEHPPSDIQLGQRFVSRRIAEVMNGPGWSRSAVFFTYDENGGFFDHVPPPRACPPDPKSMLSGFERYGMRVPFVVVSPYARPHHVSHRVLSHTSLLRMVQVRFDLPALSARDANSTPPFDLFDFTQQSFATPPELPEASVDQDELTRCEAAFAN
jgi:phospholipase C